VDEDEGRSGWFTTKRHPSVARNADRSHAPPTTQPHHNSIRFHRLVTCLLSLVGLVFSALYQGMTLSLQDAAHAQTAPSVQQGGAIIVHTSSIETRMKQDRKSLNSTQHKDFFGVSCARNSGAVAFSRSPCHMLSYSTSFLLLLLNYSRYKTPNQSITEQPSKLFHHST
jgi:hypothetical protein